MVSHRSFNAESSDLAVRLHLLAGLHRFLYESQNLILIHVVSLYLGDDREGGSLLICRNMGILSHYNVRAADAAQSVHRIGQGSLIVLHAHTHGVGIIRRRP